MNNFSDIPGYEGEYMMNLTGNVKSLPKVRSVGRGYQRTTTERILKDYVNNMGYRCLTLSKNGEYRKWAIHVLLAKTFIPNPNNYPLVRHLNDDPLDNRIENLAWGTKSDNGKDAISNNKITIYYGESHPGYMKRGKDSANSKIIFDTQTGIFYFGTKEAALAKCINPGTLAAKLNGYTNNNTSLIRV